MSAPEQRREFGRVGRLADAVASRVADAVPAEAILDHVDIDALLDRVDVNHLLDRIDVDRLLDRIDVDRLMERVDVNALLADVDLNDLVLRAGIPAIVADTTGQLAGSGLDTARRQLIGVDTLLGRVADRLLRRTSPIGPAALVARVEGRERDGRTVVTGRYAGACTRALAALADVGITLLGYTLGIRLLSVMADVFFGGSLPDADGWWAAAGLATWTFLYLVCTTAISGRTPGMALVGLRIVHADGTPLRPMPALVRVLLAPLSSLLLGLGYLLVLVDARHRTAHDMLTRTVLVYDWGRRDAQIPAPLSEFLRRHQV
ncbi:RDD family protein [Nocardioides dubius]|uniref:RDD domain-containing protein n=1 Tax=Nocardioides dubius TaxID=317019 RepID=A0ABN1TM72_9ACTN